MKWKMLAVILLLAIGLGTAAYVVLAPGGGSQGGTSYLSAAVTRTTVERQVVATGNVVSAATYNLVFGSEPVLSTGTTTASTASGSGGTSVTWAVKTVVVAPGDHVSAGAELATADSSSAEAALLQAQANLAAAQSRLTLDTAGSTAADKASARDSVRQAQQQLTVAKQTRTLTAQQNALKLSQAKAALKAAKAKLAADIAASAPAEAIDADQSAVTQSQQQLDTLTLTIRASNAQAANQVTSAQLGLTSAQHGYTSKTAPATAATIASDRAAVTSAENAVTAAQNTLDNATLVSPVDGFVTAVNVVAGSDAPSGAAITVADGRMKVSASVTETDRPSLKVGQTVSVTITAVGATATGKLTEISPVGSSSGTGGVVSYPIAVSLDSAPDGTAAGMSAQIAVTIAQAADVLAVPVAAISGTDGQYSVRVLDASGSIQTVSIEIGLATSTLVEVRSGLSEGQRVVTGVVTPRTGTSTTTGGGMPGFGGGFRPNDNGGRTNQP